MEVERLGGTRGREREICGQEPETQTKVERYSRGTLVAKALAGQVEGENNPGVGAVAAGKGGSVPCLLY